MIRRTFFALAASSALATSAFGAAHTMDIVATATEAGNFSTLIAAVEAAGLAETLSGEGPFTVFAPTDEAFAALPEGIVEALTMPENQETLTQILQHHVVDGMVMSTDLEDGMEAETMNGPVTVSLGGDMPMVGDANIVTPDVEASNGVIHAIDAVLLPEGVELPEPAM